MRTFTQQFRRAFRFFHENGNVLVGQQAVCAIEAVRAEIEANERDWYVLWTPEEGFQDGPKEWGWSDSEVARWEFQFWTDSRGRLQKTPIEHCCEVATLYDAMGNVLDSLGGIWDAKTDYRRVVEADLYSNALSALKKETQVLCNCCKRSVDSVGTLNSYVNVEGRSQSLCNDCSIAMLDILMDEEMTSIQINNIIDKIREEARK